MGISQVGDLLEGLDQAMAINTGNDRVVIFKAGDGWRWKRVDRDNGREVSQSSEGYQSREYAIETAQAYNSDIQDFEVHESK